MGSSPNLAEVCRQMFLQGVGPGPLPCPAAAHGACRWRAKHQQKTDLGCVFSQLCLASQFSLLLFV